MRFGLVCAAVTVRVVVMAAFLAVPCGMVRAQTGPPSGAPRDGQRQPPTPAMELQRLAGAMQAASVPLNDIQQAKILGVLEDRETAMKALRASGATGDDANTQRDKLMAASRASIRAVLSEAQARVFDALPAGPPGGAPGGGPPSRGATGQTDSLIDANTGGDPQSAL